MSSSQAGNLHNFKISSKRNFSFLFQLFCVSFGELFELHAEEPLRRKGCVSEGEIVLSGFKSDGSGELEGSLAANNPCIPKALHKANAKTFLKYFFFSPKRRRSGPARLLQLAMNEFNYTYNCMQ